MVSGLSASLGRKPVFIIPLLYIKLIILSVCKLNKLIPLYAYYCYGSMDDNLMVILKINFSLQLGSQLVYTFHTGVGTCLKVGRPGGISPHCSHKYIRGPVGEGAVRGVPLLQFRHF